MLVIAASNSPGEFRLSYLDSSFYFSKQLFLVTLMEIEKLMGTDSIVNINSNFSIQTRALDPINTVNLVFESKGVQMNVISNLSYLEHQIKDLGTTVALPKPDQYFPPVFPVSTAPLEKAKWFQK